MRHTNLMTLAVRRVFFIVIPGSNGQESIKILYICGSHALNFLYPKVLTDVRSFQPAGIFSHLPHNHLQ